MEDNRSATRTLGKVIFQHKHRRSLHICDKLFARGHSLHNLLRFLALLQHLNSYLIDLLKDIVGIVKPEGSTLAHKRRKGDISTLSTIYISDNIYTLKLI